MSPTLVGEKVDMVHSWLHNGVRHPVTSWLSFTNNNGTYYFGEASLGAATDIVAAGRGNVNYLRRDLQQVSSLVLGMVGQPPPCLLYQLATSAGIMMGRWTVVTDQLAIILARGVSPAQRGDGSVLGERQHPEYFSGGLQK